MVIFTSIFKRNLTSFWRNLAPFRITLASLGVIWAAKWRPRSVPDSCQNGVQPPKEPRTSPRPHFGGIQGRFWDAFGPSGTCLGTLLGDLFGKLLSFLLFFGSLRLHPCLRLVHVQPRLFLSRASRSHVKKGFYFSLFGVRRRCETVQERGKRIIVYISIFDATLEGKMWQNAIKM